MALDNKIEQAMVSGITASFPSPDLAPAYVTQGGSERVGAKAKSLRKLTACLLSPLEALGRVPSEWHLLGHFQATLAGPSPFLLLLPSQGFVAASGSLLGPWQGRELRPLDLSASHSWQGPELIGCHRTAVPLQSLGWGQELGGNRKQSTPPLLPPSPGRGRTPASSQNGCRGLGPPAVLANTLLCPGA